MSLRITAGEWRGRSIRTVAGQAVRPSPSMLREALFNMIGPAISGARFLDLCAGSGAVGIEALSRGARFVRLNDLHRQAVNTIRANLSHTRLEANAEVSQQDAFTLLKKVPDRRFDYIYIAPPQYKNLWKDAIQILDQNPGWLSEESWVIVQIDPVEYDSVELRNLAEFDKRKYGSTLLVFYEPTPASKQ